MLERESCPQCSSVGIKSHLQIYQINLDEAIVLCENKQCTYPIEKPHKSVTPTFQRSFSNIAQQTSIPDVAHQALQDRVASHMRKNGHSLQKDDIGIQTDGSKTRRKHKSSALWRKHRPVTSSVDVSQCFQKFQLLSNDVHGHENSECESKARRSCYGSDGASDRDSSNSSQDGVDSTNHSSLGFSSENSFSRLNGCSMYKGFQFSNKGNKVCVTSDGSTSSRNDANSNKVNVKDMQEIMGNIVQGSDLIHRENSIQCLPSNSVLPARDASVQLNDVTIQDSGASIQSCDRMKSIPCVQTSNHVNSLSQVLMSDTSKSMAIGQTLESMAIGQTMESMAIGQSLESMAIGQTLESIPQGQMCTNNKNKANIQTVVSDRTFMTKEQNERLTLPCRFLQWRNCDALCWLDVILCLAVHNEKLKRLVLGQTFDRENIIYKLIKAHQQATELINGSMHRNSKRNLNHVVSSHMDNNMKQNVNIAQHDSVFKQNNTSQSDDAPYTCHETDGISQLYKSSYKESITEAEGILNDVREEVWSILNKKLRCDKGKPESPVFALPLLLHESAMLKELFTMKYRFVYQCSQCKRDETTQHSNCLPTFPMVTDDFTPSFPQHLKTCSHCRSDRDRRRMVYEKLPPTLLMHFTDGIPHTDFTRLQFSHHGYVYTVTGVVQYKKNPNHFVAWLRNHSDKMWLRCDDLKTMVCEYQTSPPNFPSDQVHIVMWETMDSDRREPTTPDVKVPATCNVKVPATCNVEVPATCNVEVPATCNVEVPATRNVEVPATPDVEVPATRNVEVPATPDVEVPATRDVEVPATRNVEVPATRDVEVPATCNLEVPATRNVEVPATRNVEVPVTRNVEVPATRNVEVPATRNVEVPATRNVEVPATRNLEVTATRKISINSTKLTNEYDLAACSSNIQDIHDGFKTSVKLGALKYMDVTKVIVGGEYKKRELNLCSNDNRSSTLSTDSSDSILLPHFVTSTPMTGTLVKPEPLQVTTLHTMSTDTPQRLASKDDGSKEVTSNTSSVLIGCDISGERKALKPSSVFIVPVKTISSLERSDDNIVTNSVPSFEDPDNLVAQKSHQAPECSLTHKQAINISQSLQVTKMDQNTILKDAETKVLKTLDILNGKKCMENVVKCQQETNPFTRVISDNGGTLINTKVDSKNGNSSKTCLRERHQSNSNRTPVTVLSEKSNSAVSVDSLQGSVKPEVAKVMATKDSSANNNKFGSKVLKKSRFKVPIPAVRKASISKDAFFTLDVKSKTSNSLHANSSLSSAALATGLNGDVSVLNSVKQYLLSRTTDKSVPKLKFKGMDLKSSSRSSSCSELELARCESSLSVDAICFNNSTPVSISSFSEHIHSLSTNSCQEKRQVCHLKRKSDISTLENVKRKCTETKLHDTGASVSNDTTPRHVHDRENGPSVPNMSDGSSIEIEAISKHESGNSNNVNIDKYEDTIQLENLYKALNIPYNSVSDLVCATTGVDDILDCFKIT